MIEIHLEHDRKQQQKQGTRKYNKRTVFTIYKKELLSKENNGTPRSSDRNQNHRTPTVMKMEKRRVTVKVTS